MSGLPMSNSRREQQKKARAQVAISAANATTVADSADAKRKAVMNVVQVWLDRLQLISTITTFFAGIDGTILSFAFNLAHVSSIDKHDWSKTVKTMNSALMGALIFHVCAAITSFVASFVLIRYKLTEEREFIPRAPRVAQPSTDSQATQIEKPMMSRFESAPPTVVERTHSTNSTTSHAPLPFLRATHVQDLFDVFQNWSDSVSEVEGRVSVHQVRFLNCFGSRHNDTHLDPPIRLLSRCHTLSVTMALLGFMLMLLGILVFAWVSLPQSVSVFASACLGGCLLSIFAVFNFS